MCVSVQELASHCLSKVLVQHHTYKRSSNCLTLPIGLGESVCHIVRERLT